MIEAASNFTDLTQKVNEVNTKSNSLGLTYLISMVPSSSSTSNSSISDSRLVASSCSKINEEKQQTFKERIFILNYYPVDCSISIFEEFFPFPFLFLNNSFSHTYIFLSSLDILNIL